MKLPEEYTEHRALYRAVPVDDIEVETSDDVWHVRGRLVPYGQTVEIGEGVTETFEPGAFRKAANAPSRIKFRGVRDARSDGHLGEVVGHAVSIEDRPDGAWGDFKIVDTAAGIDVQKLLRSGTLDELSIEFTTLKDGFTVERRGKNVHVRHSRARLLAVSPVPVGAYGRDALVTQVRSVDSAARDAIIARLRSLTS